MELLVDFGFKMLPWLTAAAFISFIAGGYIGYKESKESFKRLIFCNECTDKKRIKDLEKFLKWAMENGATESDFKLALKESQGK
jgi:hypothetical protein